MAIDWTKEMANLAGIGGQYDIYWPPDLADSLKHSITAMEKDENKSAVEDLTRAFGSLLKIRNYFLTGE